MTIRFLLAILLNLAFVVTVHAGEKEMVSSLTTYRLGRFAVDLPFKSVVNVDARYRGAKVSGPVEIHSFDDLERKLDLDAKMYSESKMIRSDVLDELLRNGGFDPEVMMGSTQLVTYHSYDKIKQAFIAYHPDRKETDLTVDYYKATDEGVYKFEVTQGMTPELEKYLVNLRKSTVSFRSDRGVGAIPDGAFCVKNGYFDDHAAKPFYESADLTSTLGGHRGAFLRISTAVRVKDDQLNFDLEKEAGSHDDALTNLGLRQTVLRRGRRTVGGQIGYEVAESLTDSDDGGRPSYVFIWTALGELQDPRKQIVNIDLRISPTSDGRSTVSSPEDAEEIWDRIVGSFRPM